MVMPLHAHPCPVDGCGGKVYSTFGPNGVRRVDWLHCWAHPVDDYVIVPFDTRPPPRRGW